MNPGPLDHQPRPSTPPRVLPRRRPDSHKGDFGRILIFAGSWGMHGAAALAAAAAFRSGAGLVRLALPESVYPLVGPLEPRATYLPLPEEGRGRLAPEALALLRSAAADSDVVAVGPGLGADPRTRELLQAWLPGVDRPLVVDADALNAFAGEPIGLTRPGRPTLCTPHPGELRRLTGKECGRDDESRRLAAIDLAMRVAGVVVLKGRRSVVTDGMEVHFNPTGNPGMACGGSGDVLTGSLAAVLAVVKEPLAAARLATWAHGRAGDLARERWGEIGLTSTDLLDHLPRALEELLEPAAETEPPR